MAPVNNFRFNLSFNPLDTAGSTEQEEIISDEMAKLILKVMLYGLTPAIGIVGIVLNSFSIIVLVKHGLHKCSNILLVSLAFSDISFLIGYNNIPNLIYSLQGGGKFVYSESVSFVLYVFFIIGIVIDYTFGLASLCIPALITFERLVAVFMPLKFGQIITPFRTWVAVGGVFLFWLVSIGYTSFWYKFEYVWDDTLNTSVGLISKSDLFYKDFHAIPVFEEILFSIKVPPLFTVVGCVAIVVKVKIMSLKRSAMTSSKIASTSKTTKTLLAVCFAYLCTCALLAVPTYLPKYLSAYSLTTDNPTNMAIIIYSIANFNVSCNSAINFLVYVGFNQNFRDTFKEILRTKLLCKIAN